MPLDKYSTERCIPWLVIDPQVHAPFHTAVNVPFITRANFVHRVAHPGETCSRARPGRIDQSRLRCRRRRPPRARPDGAAQLPLWVCGTTCARPPRDDGLPDEVTGWISPRYASKKARCSLFGQEIRCKRPSKQPPSAHFKFKAEGLSCGDLQRSITTWKIRLQPLGRSSTCSLV